MRQRTVLIFTAVRMETRAVARALGLSVPRIGPARGEAYGHYIELDAVGVRAVRMPRALPANAGCVIMAGFGGALDPGLSIGDVVVDWPAGMTAGHPAVRPAGPFACGRIHTTQEIVATPEAKSALFRQTRSPAVDMENESVRRLAEAAGVPFVGVRAISDTAAQALDPAVVGLVDEMGRPRPAAVAAYLLRRPGRVLYLRDLSAAASRAARQLGEAMRCLLQSPALAQLLNSPATPRPNATTPASC